MRAWNQARLFEIARSLFALKIALSYLHFGYEQPSALTFSLALLGVAGFAATFRQTSSRLGFAMLAGLALFEVARTFPFTLNHRVFEAMVALVFTSTSAQSAGGLVRALVLSVWVYAGLQKLFHGYYWSGEYYALELLEGDGRLARMLAVLLDGKDLAALGKGAVCCGVTPLALSARAVSLFALLGRATVVTEIAIPLLAANRRSWKLGSAGLAGLQTVVAFTSGEWDFALTNLALAPLFLTPPPQFTLKDEPALARLVFFSAFAWPVVHLSASRVIPFSPWRLAGWGMYAVPAPGTQREIRIGCANGTVPALSPVLLKHALPEFHLYDHFPTRGNRRRLELRLEEAFRGAKNACVPTVQRWERRLSTETKRVSWWLVET